MTGPDSLFLVSFSRFPNRLWRCRRRRSPRLRWSPAFSIATVHLRGSALASYTDSPPPRCPIRHQTPPIELAGADPNPSSATAWFAGATPPHHGLTQVLLMVLLIYSLEPATDVERNASPGHGQRGPSRPAPATAVRRSLTAEELEAQPCSSHPIPSSSSSSCFQLNSPGKLDPHVTCST